jgi:hypothetical protein
MEKQPPQPTKRLALALSLALCDSDRDHLPLLCMRLHRSHGISLMLLQSSRCFFVSCLLFIMQSLRQCGTFPLSLCVLSPNLPLRPMQINTG